MAEVVLASASEKQVWLKSFASEYVRESGLKPYMGASESAIIRVIAELKGQGAAFVNFPLITRLKGQGVRGSQVLKGNEDDLGNFNDQVFANWIRNAVKIPKSTSYRTEIDLMDAARSQLRSWDSEILRDDVLDAMASMVIAGVADAQGIAGTDSAINYPLASAAQRNTHLTNNADRILFGNSISNGSSNVFATALANVDSVNDKLTASVVLLAKRIARRAGQATNSINIRPFKSDMTAGREWFVLFTPSLPFRDLAADTTIINANTQARSREGAGMESNPLFQDGDLIYNGVIIREIPEMPVLVGVGAGAIDVGASFLCGQGAVNVAYVQDPDVGMDKTEDYNFRPAVYIEECRGIKKCSFRGRQYGMVTLYNSAVADA